ncbi:hypothetical protein [Natronosalvus caseinilyticus]|uniref:hypothetical protein n=1 Tax=Natronosalvus caseinilyticus TaxID=2953747 RepID=UPI0028ADC232|nr:hypothetical protein [Natronosalvus caseinilyticus]
MPEQIRCESCDVQVRATASECPHCGERLALVNRTLVMMVIGALLLPVTVAGLVGVVTNGSFGLETVGLVVVACLGPGLLVAGYRRSRE